MFKEIFEEPDIDRFVKKLNAFGREFPNIDTRSDDDYVINRPQWEKMVEVLEFFANEAEENETIELKPSNLSPRNINGGVEISFEVLDLYGEKFDRFREILRHAKGIEMNTTLSGKAELCITIPRVFVRKS